MGINVLSRDVFREFVQVAMRACGQAEAKNVRPGRGRQPVIPDRVIATLIAIAVAARRKTKSAQFRFLWAHAEELRSLGVWPLPKRTTYFERYRRAWRVLQRAIACEGKLATKQRWADVQSVAADKSMVAAQGPPAHRWKGKPCRVHGVDRDAGWSCSEHDGWVYGYGYEVIVSAGKQGPVWPLLASVEPGNRHETKMIRDKLPQLPHRAKSVLADRGYDADDLTELIEWRNGRRTGRRFLCPLIRRCNARRTPKQVWPRTQARRTRQTHRQARAAYCASPMGRRLYRRRRVTVEPFNAWLKDRFHLQNRVWHRGLDNNRTQILAAIFSYQLVLHLNRIHGNPTGSIAWLLDAL
jgi:hypothetical protein